MVGQAMTLLLSQILRIVVTTVTAWVFREVANGGSVSIAIGTVTVLITAINWVMTRLRVAVPKMECHFKQMWELGLILS